jgi:hypothetical protein
MKIIESLFLTVLLVVALWLVGTAAAWQINNPKANQMTFWTHFNDAIHFRSLPQFQE